MRYGEEIKLQVEKAKYIRKRKECSEVKRGIMKGAACSSCAATALVGISISSSNHHRNPKTLSKFSLPFATTISNLSSSLYTSAIAPPLASTYYCSGKNVRRGFVASSLSVDSESPSPDLALLLEVEGVLMDVYRLANRQAFNLAFKKLGLDCANWTEPIYLDLLRKAASNEEKMLFLFFNRIGWPTSLPTNEKEAFTKSVLVEKQNALDELVMTKSLPLRPGLENFVDDALFGGIPVVILTTYSKNGEKMARSIIEQLGQERISRIQIVGKEEMERSFYGQLVLGKGASSGLDEQLAKEARKAASAEKQKIAKEIASMLKVSVDIDTSTNESSEKIVATLRAGAEYAGVPVKNCVLIAGSQPGVLGAQRIGMSCIVLRSSLTSRAEFPSANAVMDGFGGADLTLSRLRLTRGF